MAKQILGPLTQVTVNGTDLSQYCTQIAISDEADQVEVTGFAETYREFQPGLKQAEISANFIQDYAASAVDSVLSTMYAATTNGTVKVKPDTSGTVVYTMVSKLYQYGAVNGGVGEANSIDVTWQNASTAGLTRGTS